MSAFIVSPAHIDALIQAGIRAGHPARGGYTLTWEHDHEPGTEEGARTRTNTRHQLTRETGNRIGAMLWNENKRSVDHRYDRATDREVYRFAESRVTAPVAILKALSCYEYQTCEHPEWETSEARAFCTALRDAVITMLPGYDTADWAI